MDRDMCAMFLNCIRALTVDDDNKFLKSVKMVLPIFNFEGTYIPAISVFTARSSSDLAVKQFSAGFTAHYVLYIFKSMVKHFHH